MTERTRLARFCLRIALIPLAGCALGGIAALLLGGLGKTAMQILGTCAITAFASLAGLGCALPYDRRLWRKLAVLGMCASGAMCVSLLLLVWTDLHRHDNYWKLPFLLTTASMALSHISMLTVARLAPQYQWARVATVIAITGLALSLSTAAILEEGEDVYMRVIGVFAILAALGTVAVPILHRLSALGGTARIAAETIEDVKVVCPRCHHSVKLFVGTPQACSHCELEMKITVATPLRGETSLAPVGDETTATA